jgi:hypothetical protein
MRAGYVNEEEKNRWLGSQLSGQMDGAELFRDINR